MNHFDEITCLQYLDGQLDRTRAGELAAHAETCGDCRRLLSALERESRVLREAVLEQEEPVPARLLAPPARETTPWAWIAALGLAAGGAYTLWTGILEPWQEQFSQAGFGQSNLLAFLFFGGVFWKGWGDMQEMLQLLASVTLGILALGLLRRGWRRWTTVALVMGSLAVMAALPPGASAAEIRRKTSFVLPEGEVFKNDLILATQTAKIEGTIDGDLIVFCHSLTITGRVTGDVIAFAHSLRIPGSVDGSVRVFANSLAVSGSVGRNVTLFAQNFDLDRKAQVRGGVMLFVQGSTLEGRIARDLLAMGERINLNGFIGGNARVRGERLSIAATAEVQGKTQFRGRRQPEVEAGAKLASPIEVEIVHRGPDYASPGFYWRQALRWGAAFLFGLVVALLFPMFLRDATQAGNRYAPSLGAGAVALILTPIAAAIACITLVGLAVGIVTVLLWAISIYAAQVFAGAWLGTKMLGDADHTGAGLGRLAAGLLAIRVLGNLPYLGGLFWLAVILMGMGAMTLAIYQRLRPQPAGA